MRVSPEIIGRKIGNAIKLIRQHPHEAVASACGVAALVLMGARMPEMNRIESERWEKENQAAIAAQAALISDYAETSGVDMNRVGDTDTFLFTVSRKSAVLAGSTQEILEGVIAKVAKQTGCPSIIISAVSDSKPTLYSAIAICPK